MADITAPTAPPIATSPSTPTSPPPTPSTESTTAPAGGSWINAITDSELVGSFQNHGWDRLEPAQAAVEAMKSYRNAEKMLGAPADKLLRMPTRPDDEAGWRNLYQKLGAPEKAEDYDFTGIEFDGIDGATDRFISAIRGAAAELNMPKAMAERMAQTFHKYIANEDATIAATTQAQLADETRRLEADWGARGSDRYRANEFIADQAIKALGVGQDALNKLRDGLGASEAAKLFHRIGLQMGEDKYVAGQNPAQPGLMSRDQAAARRTELMRDRDFVTRYNAGDMTARREMNALDMIIVGQGGAR